jgi:ankyrin repeat protein
VIATDAGVAGAHNDQGVSALLMTLYHGRNDMTGVLLEAAAPVDAFEAAALGRTDRVRELITQESSLLEARSADGFTALHLSAFFGHLETSLLLVEQGAAVAAVSSNGMKLQPLHSAAASGSAEIVTLLLEAGAPANARQQGGFTALHAAAMHDRWDMARVLLRFGADPRQPTGAGKSALQLAEAQGYDVMVGLLNGG